MYTNSIPQAFQSVIEARKILVVNRYILEEVNRVMEEYRRTEMQTALNYLNLQLIPRGFRSGVQPQK